MFNWQNILKVENLTKISPNKTISGVHWCQFMFSFIISVLIIFII